MKPSVWNSDETIIAVNPYSEKDEQEKVIKKLQSVQIDSPSFWIATSGTLGLSQMSKWSLLSKKAILLSAKSVNQLLRANTNDIWVNALPTYHIGGLSIFARGYLSDSNVVDFRKKNPKWSAEKYVNCLNNEKATLSALVPTQLFDIIRLNLKAPHALRALIIGGGCLDEKLYLKALKLGWPVMPSYGMTECASQIATAEIDSIHSDTYPPMRVLDHVNVSLDSNGCFVLKSGSLITQYALIQDDTLTVFDPKENGYLKTNDKGVLRGDFLEFIGRLDRSIKIMGENVNIDHLQTAIDTLRLKMHIDKEACVIDAIDERKGACLVLVHEGINKEKLESFLKAFNQQAAPYERIHETYSIDKILRSAIGKLRYKEIKELYFHSCNYRSNST